MCIDGDGQYCLGGEWEGGSTLKRQMNAVVFFRLSNIMSLPVFFILYFFKNDDALN